MSEETKRCSTCKIVKSVDEFYRNKNTRDGRAYDCKGCRNADVAAWKAANPERVKSTEEKRQRDRSKEIPGNRARRATPEGKAKLRRYRLKSDHGMTQEEYDEQLAEQGGLCAICKQPPRGGPTHHDQMLHIDHHHETGRRRKLLCRSCNVGLGHFEDSIERMLAAVEYLREFELV